MMAGHYATTLVAKSQTRQMPLWLLLILSQFTDFFFVVLSILGIEPIMAYDGPLGFIVEMTYSHDLVPVLVQVGVLGLIVHLIYKRKDYTLWAVIIVAGHAALDFVSGYKHHIMGPHTLSYGIGNYANNLVGAIIIEIIVIVACILYFVYANKRDGVKLSPTKYVLLSLVLILPTIGILLTR